MTTESPRHSDSTHHVSTQVTAGIIGPGIAASKELLIEKITLQEHRFDRALQYIRDVEDFVGDPSRILGSPSTKHGEIAERVHVGVTNAFNVVDGEAPTATFDGIGRLDPADYVADGVEIQSKYINGLRNSLDHVIKHLEKYPDFHENGGYHIPADQFESLQELITTGKVEGLSQRAIQALQFKLEVLESKTGLTAEELIGPGNATYAEVQQGAIVETLENRTQTLEQKSQERIDSFKQEHAPTVSEGLVAAGAGAAVGAGLRLGTALFRKYREGKNPFTGEFTLEDWRDVGIEAGKGGLMGGISGGLLYGLTHATDLAAPFAGAFVSASMGIGALVKQYANNEIDAELFLSLSLITASEASVVGLCSFAGQAICPIPVLGAVVGSLAGKLVMSLLKNSSEKASKDLMERLAQYEADTLRALDAEFQKLLQRVGEYFENLDRFAAAAFDVDLNVALRLGASASFAAHMKVDDAKILRTEEDLDKYILS